MNVMKITSSLITSFDNVPFASTLVKILCVTQFVTFSFGSIGESSLHLCMKGLIMNR